MPLESAAGPGLKPGSVAVWDSGLKPASNPVRPEPSLKPTPERWCGVRLVVRWSISWRRAEMPSLRTEVRWGASPSQKGMLGGAP